MSSKLIEMAFFCNVIIFYCFLELLETPTVFFFKILILGQCYTFVHQNCATDLYIQQTLMPCNGIFFIKLTSTVFLYVHQSFGFTIDDLETIEEIGSGTCGQVCKMKHKQTGDVMAVKVQTIDCFPAISNT